MTQVQVKDYLHDKARLFLKDGDTRKEAKEKLIALALVFFAEDEDNLTDKEIEKVTSEAEEALKRAGG